MKQLAQYSNDLPISWFTTQFIDTLLQLKIDYDELSVLEPIVTLCSSWLRRLSSMNDPRLALVMDTLLNLLLENDNRILTAQKNAWIGWVSLIGKTQDVKLLEGMTRVIQLYTQINNEERIQFMSEAMDGGFAHALAQTNAMNDFEVESCQQLLDAQIHYVAKRPDGPRAIMTAIEHVVDIRSQETPQTRAEADLNTLVTMANDVVEGQAENLSINFVRLAVLAGVV